MAACVSDTTIMIAIESIEMRIRFYRQWWFLRYLFSTPISALESAKEELYAGLLG